MRTEHFFLAQVVLWGFSWAAQREGRLFRVERHTRFQCERACWRCTHYAGVSQVLVCHVGAGRADLPGVSKQLRSGFHDALPRGEVVLRVAVKVATQASDSTPQVGCQAHIHTHTCRKRGDRVNYILSNYKILQKT